LKQEKRKRDLFNQVHDTIVVLEQCQPE